MAGFQTDLLEGVAQHLAGLGIATWDPAGVYTSAQTGIVLATVPASPDRIITLSGYGIADSPNLSDSLAGLQVRTRWDGGDPRPVDDLADRIFDELHGLTGLLLPTGVQLVLCLRTSWTSMGQDANRRWSRSDNYSVTAHRPSPHRT